jgi:hypothetical protein
LKRDYTSVCGVSIGLIASAMVGAVFVANWNAEHKLAGLEVFVVGPVALLLYCVGLCFSAKAYQSDSDHRKLAIVGILLNSLPLIFTVIVVMVSIS